MLVLLWHSTRFRSIWPGLSMAAARAVPQHHVSPRLVAYQGSLLPCCRRSGRTTPRGGLLTAGSMHSIDGNAGNKGSPMRGGSLNNIGSNISSEVLADKERSIIELRETNEV
eukprot:GHUV01032292.1.p2 GENE.GHUV01032292.1~~GHUV01032292.1.p2  ORF type:complete len:112 (+),score=29.12 GHUV01032292.1:600-935(+)